MPRGVRNPKPDDTATTPTLSLSEQIAENQRQIIETEKQLNYLKEQKEMLLALKEKSDTNEIYTLIKQSGASVTDLLSKLQIQTV